MKNNSIYFGTKKSRYRNQKTRWRLIFFTFLFFSRFSSLTCYWEAILKIHPWICQGGAKVLPPPPCVHPWTELVFLAVYKPISQLIYYIVLSDFLKGKCQCMLCKKTNKNNISYENSLLRMNINILFIRFFEYITKESWSKIKYVIYILTFMIMFRDRHLSPFLFLSSFMNNPLVRFF